jgi:hypothetical protein
VNIRKKIRLNPWLILLLALQTTLAQTPNCGCDQKPQINVLAVVNGVKITQRDLSINTRTQVSLAQETVITARAKELDFQINKMLLEREAKRRGVTNDVLLLLEVKARVVPATEAEARAFYEQNKTRIGRGFSSVKNEILAQLNRERESLRAYQFANALRAGVQITGSNMQVTPPTNEADLSRVFATINGVQITSENIERSLLPLIFLVQQQVYEYRKRDLDLRINDVLLEQESKRLGMTPEALIDINVRSKVPIVGEEQARAYYNEQKNRLEGRFSDVKLQIMQLLQEQEAQKWFVAYAEELRKGAAVQIYLTAPKPPTLDSSVATL